jgi:hypothetical protein
MSASMVPSGLISRLALIFVAFSCSLPLLLMLHAPPLSGHETEIKFPGSERYSLMNTHFMKLFVFGTHISKQNAKKNKQTTTTSTKQYTLIYSTNITYDHIYILGVNNIFEPSQIEPFKCFHMTRGDNLSHHPLPWN